MSKLIDIIQTILFLAGIGLWIFVGWKIGVMVLIVNVVIGITRVAWVNSHE